jgi:hypothetical protein
MFAFPECGRFNCSKSDVFRGRFRPGAAIAECLTADQLASQLEQETDELGRRDTETANYADEIRPVSSNDRDIRDLQDQQTPDEYKDC